jgi:hypothetical protein
MQAVHVIVSVGWLGTDLCILALGITGQVTSNPHTRYAAYTALAVMGRVMTIPISLLALLTGLLLALGTAWGLVRNYWVLVKLTLTLIAVILTIFPLRFMMTDAAAEIAKVPVEKATSVGLGMVGINLIVAPIVALCLYSTNVVLSIFKPWGKTIYGRRAR